MARPRVSGQSRLRRQLRRFDPAFREDLTKALQDGGNELATEIAARAPKDEGNLAAEVQAKMSTDSLSCLIGYSKNKVGFKRPWKRGGFEALWQEFGTRAHAAQPFIRPSYRAKLSAILNRIDDGRRKAIQKILSET